MARSARGLLPLAVLTLLAEVAVLLGPDALRVPFGLMFALALPGLAIISAAVPRSQLGLVERAVLAVGLSMIVAVFLAFVLNWLPGGVQPSAWLIALGLIPFASILIRWLRTGLAGRTRDEAESGRREYLRLRVSASPRALPAGVSGSSRDAGGRKDEGDPSPYDARIKIDLGEVADLAVAALILVVSFMLAAGVASSFSERDLVQLWMLRADDSRPWMQQVGVANLGSTPSEYRLRFRQGDRELADWKRIEMGPGDRWETSVDLAGLGAQAGLVEAILYRLDAPNVPFRRVSVWLGSDTRVCS